MREKRPQFPAYESYTRISVEKPIISAMTDAWCLSLNLYGAHATSSVIIVSARSREWMFLLAETILLVTWNNQSTALVP